MNDNQKIINESLDVIIGECFGRYAKYVIQDRALPDIRDGLKPVQRRILYAMYELGLTFEKTYKKSARTVGEVIGKYHPHGDSSIYEAMVRMSQNWKNNLPLLDMHGNNGSIDGDPAAAMRYTECKLSKVANLMLENIKNETVDFVFNFDDSEKEPKVLPSLLPNLLINGALGIAAGYATNIPPFNPSEVFDAIIKLINDDLSIKEIQKIITGPDFPTGGVIEGTQGIEDFYNTGRGKFVISSKIEIDESDSKFNQIIIKEIPYDTNKSTIIKELNEIFYDEKVSGILDVKDESDKDGVCIVIDVKKDKNLESIKNYIFKNTHLQINYSVNFIAIVNLKPVLLDIKSALLHYINNALLVRKKAFIFDLKKAEKRYEIINGLIIAIKNIDEVISIIRQSESKDDAKQKLIAKFFLSEIQAEAIVVLRLYRLSKTDISSLMNEAHELSITINNLKELINSETLQKQSLAKLLLEYKKEFGVERKTQITNELSKVEINEIDIIDIQNGYIFVSRDGYIKLVTTKIYESNFYNDLGNKNGDFIFFSKQCKNNETLLLVSRTGKTLALPIYKIQFNKWKDVGEHVNSFMNLDSNDKIIFADVLDNFSDMYHLIIMTNDGITKKMILSEAFNNKQIKQSYCTKLKGDDFLKNACIVSKNNNYFISMVSSSGKGYSFSSAEIPLLQKTANGVKSIKLKKDEYLVSFICSKTQLLNCAIVTDKDIHMLKLEEFNINSRVSTGKTIINLKEEKIINIMMCNNFSFVNLALNDNTLKCLNIAKFNKKELNNNNIIDANYNFSESHGLFEDISKAKQLPKNIQEQINIDEIK